MAIYQSIVSDSGLVKSYFVLGARKSAFSRHVNVEDEAGMPTVDPRAAQFFILIAHDISKVAECRPQRHGGEREEK